ncbi:MAG: nucleotidyltransferase domain-containing protein [Acidobacteriota bacterium]|nr:nucleotidyltransferase domain-containing protein [Acidobacteriota bacterium]
MTLHERLAAEVDGWRSQHYPSEAFPAIAEILEFAGGGEETGNVRFLRTPQLRALETYWYLRLVMQTPHTLDLYRRLFTNTSDLLEAMGLAHADLKDIVLNSGIESLLDRVRTDDVLVKKYKLEAVRETLTLPYSSYILALAMGAGKTILIGAIIATEFAMADEYPDGDFVQNALVFAPGKVILESLRELLDTRYDRVLPARFHRPFAASVKFTFTRDGDPSISVIPGSIFNVVVTNTEKIRIQKESIRKSDVGPLLSELKLDEARQEVANRRLQAIAGLPHLAVFSDEAHHTYGQSMDTDLKKVRKTVDYLAAQTNVVVVVNTTGTPYFNKQPLLDVVVWYGLSQGIREGILKDVSGSIRAYQFGDDTSALVTTVVEDFFKSYGDVRLPNGAPARLAIYFPQTDDLAEMKPVIEATLARLGLSPTLVLVNTSDDKLTKARDEEAFNHLNDPTQPERVILLVNKGTEGWNCPSLFACALARKLKTSNNFVLQAATRCLRQVPGNTHKARIYLSEDNLGVLDRQLRETYGEEIATLRNTSQQVKHARLVLRRTSVPPLVITRTEQRVTRKQVDHGALRLSRPNATTAKASQRTLVLDDRRGATRVLQQVDATVTLDLMPDTSDVFAVACELAGRYRLDALDLSTKIRELYPLGDVPESDVEALAAQIEEQTRQYDVSEELVDVALALVKPEGFTEEIDEKGRRVYTTEIAFRADRLSYLTSWEEWKDKNTRNLGFYYSPLDFDSRPEQDFFVQLLGYLNVKLWEVEDIYFTGGLTDPAKTDFYVEYKTDDGRWHRYTPDFIIRKKPARNSDPPGSGRVMIVEIKSEKSRDDKIDGANGRKAMAVRAWETLNPERLKYEMIFTATEQVPFDRMSSVFTFAEEKEMFLPIEIDRDRIAQYCRKWNIDRLELFGSVLRNDFRRDSDVDFLATFAPGSRWGLSADYQMREELKAIVGREIDLVDRAGVERSENWIRRRSILSSARPLHVS